MTGTQDAVPRTAATGRLRGARLALGALPSAVPCARAHTRAVLLTWDIAAVADNAEVVVAELVTNAVTHGSRGHLSGPIPVVRLDLLLARVLVIDVWDCSPELPVVRRRPPAPEGLAGTGGPGEPPGFLPESCEVSEGGRGLLLVSALCAVWRSDTVDGWPGKRVRAVLPIS
jgi:anti-sigma regulatory factor (Ser/Thr protein kinase)